MQCRFNHRFAAACIAGSVLYFICVGVALEFDLFRVSHFAWWQLTYVFLLSSYERVMYRCLPYDQPRLDNQTVGQDQFMADNRLIRAFQHGK